MKEPEHGKWVANMPYDYFYSAIIKVSNEESNIYKVEATVKDNEKGNEVDKKIYISR